MNPNAILNKLNQVVTKGLQGETDFEGQELSWKINQEKNKCEVSLLLLLLLLISYIINIYYIFLDVINWIYGWFITCKFLKHL